MGINYGTAMSAGIEGFMQGRDLASDRQAKQQALTMQAEQHKMNQQKASIQQDTAETQQQIATMQLQEMTKKLANEKTKDNLFRAFDDGTITAFNTTLKNDSNSQALLPGLDSIEKVDLTNPEYANQANGMAEPVLATVVTKDGKILRAVQDLSKLKARTGYSTHDNRRRTEQATSSVQATAAEQTNKDITAFFSDPKNANATYADFQATQQAAKPMTFSEQKNKFELGRDMKDAKITDYVDNNPTEFRDMLGKGNMNTKVGDMSLYSIAKKAQGDNKVATARRDYLDGMVSTLANTNRLRTKMATSEFDWDAMSKGMDELTKITGSEWRDLDEKEKKNMLDKFSFNSDLKTVMAGYIKAMSGAAVSDQERGFYEGAILGGNWATKETAIASMDGFVSGLKNGMDSAISGMVGNTPADYLDYKDRVGKISLDTTTIPTVQGKPKEPGIVDKVTSNVKALYNKYTGSSTTKDASEY